MRWSVVRLIAARETRDQLRDRRTMFLILGLPVLMYPLFVGVGTVFMYALKDKRLVVGVVGAEYLPKPAPDLTAVAGGAAGVAFESKAFPPLVVDGKIPERYTPDDPEAGGTLVVKPIDEADEGLLAARQVDAIVVVEPDLAARLERGERAAVR